MTGEQRRQACRPVVGMARLDGLGLRGKTLWVLGPEVIFFWIWGYNDGPQQSGSQLCLAHLALTIECPLDGAV